MQHIGFIGGEVGYRMLRRLGRAAADHDGPLSGDAYAGRSKLESLFGPGVWAEVSGRTVLDFGCGDGQEVIEMALRGADLAIGIDVRGKALDQAAHEVRRCGLDNRCVVGARTDQRADTIFSMDGFEHYDDPARVLATMRDLLKPEGRVFIAFGPPWLHPLGGHLFSVFPWAHLVFTERALIRWRADFKTDGARRFCEIEGGLNQMTVRRFERLVQDSPLRIESLELVPIRRLRRLFNPLTREFLTSMVRCTLVPRCGGSARVAAAASVS